MSKKIKIALYVVIGLILLNLMPFITVQTKDDAGRSWRVPFASRFVSKDDTSVSFKSIRSKYALEKDSQNALHSYTEVKCYGKKYFYDKANDVTILDAKVDGSLLNHRLTYSLEGGNLCGGWTNDDEVAFAFGPIDDVDLNISVEEALEKEWFVVKDGKALNAAAYHDFARMVKQGVYCMERMIVIDGNHRSIVDMQVMESCPKPFRVTVRDETGIRSNYYARFTDQEVGNKKIVQVYEVQSSDEEPLVLFEFE